MKTLLRLGALVCVLLFVPLAFGQAAAPVISPVAGSYASTQSVTVTDSTSGADIFCTTDGSTPTPESTKYAGAITLTSNTTIKCVAAVASVRQNNIQNNNPSAGGSYWKAVDCVNGGGSGVPTGLVHASGIASPSLSGASMEFSMTAHGSQTNCLWSTSTAFGKGDTSKWQQYDYRLYLDTGVCTNNGTTEQDDAKVAPSLGNLRYMAGAQWRRTGGCTSGHACLDLAGNSNTGPPGGSSWIFSGVDIPLPCGTWHHMQRSELFVPSEVTSRPCVDRNGAHWPYIYQRYWIVDGTKYDNGGAGWKYCANSVNWPSWEWPQHQEDATTGTHTMFIDEANFVAYFPESVVSSSAFTITGGTGTPTAATPSITPGGGLGLTTPQTVTLADSTPGAVIHYTLDGSTPTSASSTYSSALSVTTTTTVKAIAIASGYINSSVASAVYTFSSSGGLTATPTFSPTGGSFTTAQFVSLSDTTSGAVIYYTTDGTAPTTSSNVFSSALAVSATATIKAMAVAPGLTNSSIATATYTITATLIAATPTFIPAAGNYAGTQTVAIADTTPAAVIHYTTSGTTPTCSSTTYSTPLSIATTTTVKAIACASGYSNSNIGTALYTIGCGLTPYFTGNIDWSQIKPGARLGVGPFFQMAAGGAYSTGNALVHDCNGNVIEASGAPALQSAVQQEGYIYAADTGTANAYAVTLSPVPTIVAGSEVSFKVGHTNTGASTLAVNGGTATAIKKIDGATALASGDWTVGQMVTVKYDGTNWQWGGGGSSGGGTVTASAIQQQSYVYAADTGAANAYVVTLSPTPTIVAGSHVVFKATNANTGASTLAVNGGGATAIKKQGSTALASGDIAAGQVEEVVYDGTNYQLIASSSTGGSGPTLQTNGTNNASQTTLNLKSGTGATVANSGADVTISASGSGAMVLVESHTASSSAELDFTTCFTSTYDQYVIALLNVLPATNSNDLLLVFSTNGGSSYDTTSGHYAWGAWRWDATASGVSGSTSAANIALSSGASLVNSTAANGGLVGTFTVFNPLSGTMRTLVTGQSNSFWSSDPTLATSNGGSYTQTTAVNAFSVRFASGNITSGTVRCYGIAH